MELLGVLLLLAAGAFFCGTETAIYRANWIRLTNWAERNVGGARAALAVLDHRDRAIVTVLVGTNLAYNFLTILLTRFFAVTIGPASTTVAVVIAVALAFVFGEYLPKAFGQSYPNRWLRRAALPLEVTGIVFLPVVAALSLIGRLLSPRPAAADRQFRLTRADYIAALNRRAGTGAPRTARLATRLFRFSATPVGEIQIPIEEVKSVGSDAGLNALMAVTRAHGFSRVPVYTGAPDNITGVVVAKDLLSAPAYRVRRISRFPGSSRAIEVLRQLQRRGEHLAVVTDESGATTGIVSLEDLIEELVGEIRSEA
jgi:putative hemolysin